MDTVKLWPVQRSDKENLGNKIRMFLFVLHALHDSKPSRWLPYSLNLPNLVLDAPQFLLSCHNPKTHRCPLLIMYHVSPKVFNFVEKLSRKCETALFRISKCINRVLKQFFLKDVSFYLMFPKIFDLQTRLTRNVFK